jgi:hypothetical protein
MKHISVMTNDPVKPKHSLTITGKVENIVTISPQRVRFSGSAGQLLNASVSIIPEKKYPFKIIEANAKKGEHITVSIKEEKKSERTGYVLTVENLKKDKGRYVDTIVLKTTSKIQPTIKIPVYGIIYETSQKEKG